MGLFWNEAQGCLHDLLAAPAGKPAALAVPDGLMRPNQLFAVALGIVSGAPARRIVEAAARFLLVPGALRSLAPLPAPVPLPVRAPDGRLLNDPAHPYWGRYEGDEDTRRKPAYPQRHGLVLAASGPTARRWPGPGTARPPPWPPRGRSWAPPRASWTRAASVTCPSSSTATLPMGSGAATPRPGASRKRCGCGSC